MRLWSKSMDAAGKVVVLRVCEHSARSNTVRETAPALESKSAQHSAGKISKTDAEQ